MSGQGIHHVAIRAADFDATIKFYTEGLQCSVRYEFSVPGRIDRAAFLDAGDGRLIEVFGPGSLVQAEGRRRQPDEEAMRVPLRAAPPRALRHVWQTLPASPQPRCALLSSLDRMAKSSSF
jgi:catechol 2,3-dioxygenase-like lactoylglutathione lyase family enzyme